MEEDRPSSRKLGVALHKTEKKKTPEQLKKELHLYIVESLEKLVKPERLKEKGVWAKEYAIFKKLIKRYFDHERIFKHITFKVNSLAFFISPEGMGELQRIMNMINYVVPVKERVEMSDEKIGEDAKIEKPMTVKEFLERYN
jgi:hypothetical protein